MTLNLKARIVSGKIELLTPLPPGLPEGEVEISLRPADAQTASSGSFDPSSGFVRKVLLNSGEEVWEND